MDTIFRFKRPFKRSRNAGEGSPEPADTRPFLPPVDYDPMSARTLVTHFDLRRII